MVHTQDDRTPRDGQQQLTVEERRQLVDLKLRDIFEPTENGTYEVAIGKRHYYTLVTTLEQVVDLPKPPLDGSGGGVIGQDLKEYLAIQDQIQERLGDGQFTLRQLNKGLQEISEQQREAIVQVVSEGDYPLIR